MVTSRIALVQQAYKCFHEEDVDGLLEFFDDEITMTDPLTHAMIEGKEAVGQGFQRSRAAVHSMILGEIVETGDTVVVLGHHDFYDRGLRRLGDGVPEVHRFTFRGDRITKLEVTTFEEIPAEVRALLRAPDPG